MKTKKKKHIINTTTKLDYNMLNFVLRKRLIFNYEHNY